jgi:hypothetical protein
MGSRHHEPGGRAEDRRRQFEDSRGLTGGRELPLDDEQADDELAPDEQAADESEADEPGADLSDADEPEAGELDRDPDEVPSPAADQADDQG